MRLMVVDDDKNIRDILNFGMGKVTTCNRVASCASAEEALKQFGPGEFDCLVVDYKLPGMNGIDFIKKVRSIDENVGIVVISAVLDQKTADKACEGLSVYSVIEKPFALKNLWEKIAEAAELSRMPEEKQASIAAQLDQQSASFKGLGAQVREQLQQRRSDTGMLRRKMAP